MIPRAIQRRLPEPQNPQDPRLKAAEALKFLDPRAKAAVPELIKTLQEDDPMLQTASIAALGAVGPEAWESVPALTELLKDKASHIRLLVGGALWRLWSNDPAKRHADFLKLLQSLNPYLAMGAAEVLLANDPSQSQVVVPTFEKLSE